MHNFTSERDPKIILTSAETLADELEGVRASLRRATQPGEPEREAKLAEALAAQMFGMSAVRSLMARAQWTEDLLSQKESDRLFAASRRLAAERRKLKKMQRTGA